MQDNGVVIPFESRRAMARAALFASIFRETLESQTCGIIKCKMNEKEIEIFNNRILDNIIIAGGFARDMLLCESVSFPLYIIDHCQSLMQFCDFNYVRMKYNPKYSRFNEYLYFFEKYIFENNDVQSINETCFDPKSFLVKLSIIVFYVICYIIFSHCFCIAVVLLVFCFVFFLACFFAIGYILKFFLLIALYYLFIVCFLQILL